MGTPPIPHLTIPNLILVICFLEEVRFELAFEWVYWVWVSDVWGEGSQRVGAAMANARPPRDSYAGTLCGLGCFLIQASWYCVQPNNAWQSSSDVLLYELIVEQLDNLWIINCNTLAIYKMTIFQLTSSLSTCFYRCHKTLVRRGSCWTNSMNYNIFGACEIY